jgi:hypothetical protein
LTAEKLAVSPEGLFFLPVGVLSTGVLTKKGIRPDYPRLTVYNGLPKFDRIGV